MGFPKGRKAILVIHGIGQQAPFQTLEQFAAGYLKANEWQFNAKDIVLEHRVSRRTPAFREPWLESYLRIRPADCESPDVPPDRIDFHEYYWAHQTQRMMTPVDVFNWFYGVFDRAVKFARENHDALAVRDAQQRKDIIKNLDALAVSLARWRFFIRPAYWLASWFTRDTVSGRRAWSVFEKLAGVWIAEYAADVAVYTATDIKQEHFAVRQQILGGCVERLKNLLGQDDTGRDYNESVVVAAHSLGSVVAYDAISRLQLFETKSRLEGPHGHNPLRKLTGFATFGSPLDKIYMYFRDQENTTDSERKIRAQFVDQLYNLRLAIPVKAPKPGVANYVSDARLLAGLRWINYYHKLDPVSSYLLFYCTDDDVEIEDIPAEYDKFLAAHNGYWFSNAFFQDIHGRLVCGEASDAAAGE
ncbi:MAG: hypothetical protein GC168_11585 [Candidatus Hydrogenedens sp.]|nr:hypothetical protein [Candidatus Hydrogenedens sp.]